MADAPSIVGTIGRVAAPATITPDGAVVEFEIRWDLVVPQEDGTALMSSGYQDARVKVDKHVLDQFHASVGFSLPPKDGDDHPSDDAPTDDHPPAPKKAPPKKRPAKK